MLSNQHSTDSQEQQHQQQSAQINLNEDGVALTNAPAHQDEKRTSLLDVVRDSLQRQGKTTILYRIVVCGELMNGVDREEFAGFHQKFFKQQQTDADLITGILLANNATWVHILEASHKVILAYLRNLGGFSPTPESNSFEPGMDAANMFRSMDALSSTTSPRAVNASIFVRKVRVLVVVDDINHRFFPFWSSKILPLAPGDGLFDAATYTLGNSECARAVTDVCVAMMTLGTSLSNLPKNDMKQALDDIADRYSTLIPKSDSLQTIANCDEVMHLDDWLKTYDGPTKLVLESELVWPNCRTLAC